MAARKTTDLTALTTPTANTLVPAVDLTEALPSNQNKKLALSDLTKGLSAATTGAAGVVQLSTSTSSTSTSLAATPSAVKSAYDLASSASTTAAAALPRSGGTMTGAITFAGAQPTATTSAAGIVQLNDNINSTSTTQAATANAVKTAYDLANGRSRLTLGTAQATTSGTVINLDTAIPSWVRRITVAYQGVSLSGSAHTIIQLGAGSFTTSGYTSTGAYAGTGNQAGVASATNGLIAHGGSPTNALTGTMTIVAMGSNLWVASHSGSLNASIGVMGAGSITLGGTLDRIRITTTNGTDTFDAGSVNIIYEG